MSMHYNEPGNTNVLRYFQILFRNADGKNALTRSIALNTPCRPEDCLKYTTDFVRQNKIGTTGWEALKGDITAGLYRTIDSGSQEGQILAKMHGISTEQPKPETP